MKAQPKVRRSFETFMESKLEGLLETHFEERSETKRKGQELDIYYLALALGYEKLAQGIMKGIKPELLF